LSSGETGATAAVLVLDLVAVTVEIFLFFRPGIISVELNASMKPLLSKTLSGATHHNATFNHE